jgi:nucleotide-binding universal stress UspA family protein
MAIQILVPLHTYPEGNSAKAAPLVSVIARHLSAEVHAVTLVGEFPAITNTFGNMILDSAALAASAKNKCQARARDLTNAMTSELERSGVALRVSEVECMVSNVEEPVVHLARYHDLTVVCLTQTDSAPQATAQATVFDSGRPVLVMPEEAAVKAPEHVMIAWDGSRAAARAVADASDFLERARQVSLVSVTDEKELPIEDILALLAGSLERRQIRSSSARIRRDGRSISHALQEHAKDVGADLLVMGGFAHSRLRDFVLGGATSGVLRELRMPVLLSH